MKLSSEYAFRYVKSNDDMGKKLNTFLIVEKNNILYYIIYNIVGK